MATADGACAANELWTPGCEIIAPQKGPQTILLASTVREVLYGGAVGGGKALHIETEVPTPQGYRRLIDIRDGDLVYDEHGAPCRVIRAHPVLFNNRCYRMRFDDGTEVISDEDHLWWTRTQTERDANHRRSDAYRENRRASRAKRGTGKRPDLAARNIATATPRLDDGHPGKVRTMAEIIATLRSKNGSKNHSIDLIDKPLQAPDADLPLDPYLLGLWLGDGTTSTGTITTADQQILTAWRDLGFEVYQSPSMVGSYTWRIEGLTAQLRQLGVLDNKHVPAPYLSASPSQRLALLQGLMDTDGTCNKSGSVEFTNTRICLAEAVRDLACSLGHKLTMREGRAKLNGRDCGPKWTLKWTAPEPVFRLHRKAKRQRLPSRGVNGVRYLVDVQEVPSVPTRCLTVDSPSRLFLVTRACLPTHNTWALLLGPLRWVHLPEFRALIVRRESTQFADVLKKSHKIYKALFPGAYFRQQPRNEPPHWVFPSGARIYLSHCKDEDDKYNYQGIEFQYIAFDELTHFTDTMYSEIGMRIRGIVPGLPKHVRYLRASANPGGKYAEWVKRRWAPWLDSQFKHPSLPERYDRHNRRRLPPARSGQVLWFKKDAARGVEQVVAAGTRGATSRTYIESLVWDNPALLHENPDYVDDLRNSLDPARFRQVVYADWEVQEGKGLFFSKEKWSGKIKRHPPSPVLLWVRFWDIACSEEGDYFAGVRMGLCQGGEIWIEDVEHDRGDPGEVDRRFLDISKRDGIEIAVRIELEPGSGGKMSVFQLARQLHGFDVFGDRPKGSKVDRARPFSAQFNLGNVFMKRAPWNYKLINELHSFPDGLHDDQVDGCSGAYTYLIGPDAERRIAMLDHLDKATVERLARAFRRRG